MSLALTDCQMTHGIEMKRKSIINISDTDKNADWIKTPENIKTENEIHNKLADQYANENNEQ